MKLEDQLKRYLQDEPRARERHNKVRAITNFMRRSHPTLQSISVDLMSKFIDEIIALERYWRKILLDNPELRGHDYNTKKITVQNAQIRLGYESSALLKDFEKAL